MPRERKMKKIPTTPKPKPIRKIARLITSRKARKKISIKIKDQRYPKTQLLTRYIHNKFPKTQVLRQCPAHNAPPDLAWDLVQPPIRRLDPFKSIPRRYFEKHTKHENNLKLLILLKRRRSPRNNTLKIRLKILPKISKLLSQVYPVALTTTIITKFL